MSTTEAGRVAAPVGVTAIPRPLPWEKIGLITLLVATATSFLWGLDRNGWANPYYSAAAQAGSQDWKAFFFGSLEWGNLITVDKTPLSIWVMSLSVRLFGLNTWAILVPQALMGVATTYLIYCILRRGFGVAPALLGGAIYATTPVVFLMSRFNNPEPLMGLLTVAAVYFIVRAMEGNKWHWYLMAGTALGLGFMAKQVQAFILIPALVLAVLALGAGKLKVRIARLLAALAALIVSGASWMAVVDLMPAENRPYVGGTASNRVLELTFDYNGLSRFIRIPANISGDRPVVNQDELAPYNGGFSRVFDGNFAPEIAWLLFTAIALVVVLIILNRSIGFNKTQTRLAAVAVAWFTTTFLLLCFMGSMIHTYYTFSLGAPIALVIPVGLFALWTQRDRAVLRLIGAIVIGSSTYMTVRVLNYSDEWPMWFRVLVVISGIAAGAGWLYTRSLKWSRTAAGAVVVALILGPIGANTYTLSTPQNGTNPQSGPVANDPMAMSRLLLTAKEGKPAWAQQTAFGSTPTAAVTALLSQTNGEQQWAAATYSAQNAALYQLESGRPVIPLGGWLGTDPAPTPARFKELVAEGKIGYFIWQQDLLERKELSTETIEISHWIEENFQEQIIDSVRIYDLRR